MTSFNSEMWDLHWSTVPVKDKLPHRDLCMIIGELLNSGRVLEVGFGRGYILNHFSLKDYEAFGAEISREAIKHAKSHQSIVSSSTEFVKVEGIPMPFVSDYFDLVYSVGLFEHFEINIREALLQEQKRVTKEGGYIIVDVPLRRASLIGRDNKPDSQAYAYGNFGFEFRFVPYEIAEIGRNIGLTAVKEYYRNYARPLNIIRMLHDNRFFMFPAGLKEPYEEIGKAVDIHAGKYLARDGGVVFRKGERPDS